MGQGVRWLVAVGLSVVSVAATWLVCQLAFGLDVSTSATVAALTLAVVGSPAASWAGSTPAAPEPRPAIDDHPAAQVWNIPARSPSFTGRDELLQALREELLRGGPVAVLALHGMGGVGKTSSTIEYLHRFAGQYRFAWWINAERSSLIGEQLAAFGVAAGWVTATDDVSVAAREILRRLRAETGWIVVFDNVEMPQDVAAWLPQGDGHVLITSRNPAWRQLARPVEIDVFTRPESVALLRRLNPATTPADAERVAAAVGDLPLAAAQAAAFLTETGISADDYLRELAREADAVMSEGRPASYPAALAHTVRLSMDRLAREDGAAADAMRMCAMFAPELVPVEFLAAVTDGPLGAAAGSTMTLRRTIGLMGRYGLAKVDPLGPQLHRLVQATITSQLDPGSRIEIHARNERVLVAVAPASWSGPASWPWWSKILPHLLALDPASTDNARLRTVASTGARYLIERGDVRAGRDLAEHLLVSWRNRFGPDDLIVLDVAHHLSAALVWLGQAQEGLELATDTFARRGRVLGEDHVDTLNTADVVATYLRWAGRPEQARRLREATLERLRHSQGDDYNITMGVAHNLAEDLNVLGLFEESMALNEATYQRRCRVLGNEHPHTLLSAHDFASQLLRAGRTAQALDLHLTTLDSYRRTLGPDHHRTLRAAMSTADAMMQSGRTAEAAALRDDATTRRSRMDGNGEGPPGT